MPTPQDPNPNQPQPDPRVVSSESDALDDLAHEAVAHPGQTPPPAAPGRTAPPRHPVVAIAAFIWVTLFRLGLLTAGVGLGWIAGVALGHYSPGNIQDPPIQELALRRGNAVWQRLRQVRQIWQTPESRTPPILAEPLPELDTSPPALDLDEADQVAAETTLSQLQTDLEQLRDRTAALEADLGQSPAGSTVESRLSTLERQLQAEAAPESASPSVDPDALPTPPTEPPSATTPSPAAASANLPSIRPLRITLPADALFEPGGASFTANADTILFAVASDLAQYPGANILIGGHTDDDVEAEDEDQATAARSLSFNQAKALQNYLSQLLGEDYAWVTIGYGATRPLQVDDAPASRQRNRRIELSLDP
jgi:outer membrane protein OmpA-like peptidoglycan-associated protein